MSFSGIKDRLSMSLQRKRISTRRSSSNLSSLEFFKRIPRVEIPKVSKGSLKFWASAGVSCFTKLVKILAESMHVFPLSVKHICKIGVIRSKMILLLKIWTYFSDIFSTNRSAWVLSTARSLLMNAQILGKHLMNFSVTISWGRAWTVDENIKIPVAASLIWVLSICSWIIFVRLLTIDVSTICSIQYIQFVTDSCNLVHWSRCPHK